MSTPVKFTLILFTAFLLTGGANHALDIAHGGLFPYKSVPMTVNVFWTLLCPLDLAAAGLVWMRRNAGIALSLAILLADVSVNSWLLYASGLAVQSFEPLQVQTAVLGFMLGSAALVWRRETASPALKAD